MELLPPDKIKEVKDFVKFLSNQTKRKIALNQFAGSIDDEDADLMRNAIADGCEKINYEQW
ncbi:MAG: hypothetical protein V1833_06600 [Elusimicrobiota bacterium]